MIGFGDASLLAVTKLRTRRIRTLVTVATSGLLFAILIAATIIAQGASNSIQSFSKEGLNDIYVVKATSDPLLHYGVLEDPTIQTQAQTLFTQLVAAKTAEAKKLGISYDPTTELQPVATAASGPAGQQETRLNLQSYAAQEALSQYFQAHPVPGLTRLQQVASSYHPTAYYSVTSDSVDGTLTTMKNGQEDFSGDGQPGANAQQDVLRSTALEKTETPLLAPFLLPNQPKTYTSTNVPIVLTYTKAMHLLGMPTLSGNATPEQKLDQIKQLYAKAGSITIYGCYRNTVSEQQIQTAITQAAEIAANKNNTSYQKPSLIYGLPAANDCGQATVLSDTRTKAEKTADTNQDTFSRDFGQEVDPVQQKVAFHVVGLMPDQAAGSGATTVSGILQNVVGSSLDDVLAVPSTMLATMPNERAITQLLFTDKQSWLGFSPYSYFVEFGNANDARMFIDGKTCTTRSDGTCATPTKPFQLTAYGSNSIGVQDLKAKFAHYFKLAALGIVIIALAIMGSMIGRTIVDGRRETAVFRAVGAKRADILVVYGIYTLCLSVCTALSALVVGLLLAYSFDQHYSLETTVEAKLLYGAANTTRAFRFFAVNWNNVSIVLAAVIACGLLSAIWPLARNVRRSPIRDMREE